MSTEQLNAYRTNKFPEAPRGEAGGGGGLGKMRTTAT
jgi:hypothetical protein